MAALRQHLYKRIPLTIGYSATLQSSLQHNAARRRIPSLGERAAARAWRQWACARREPCALWRVVCVIFAWTTRCTTHTSRSTLLRLLLQQRKHLQILAPSASPQNGVQWELRIATARASKTRTHLQALVARHRGLCRGLPPAHPLARVGAARRAATSRTQKQARASRGMLRAFGILSAGAKRLVNLECTRSYRA